MSSTRRLAAILAADVAGYSRLMGADEEGTLDRLKAHRRELVDPKIAEHVGVFSKYKLPYAFEDLGEQNVKNIARPVRAYAMAPAAVSTTPLVQPPRSGPVRRLHTASHRVAAAGVLAVACLGSAAWWLWPDRNLPSVCRRRSDGKAGNRERSRG
jgi:hypothetical protein